MKNNGRKRLLSFVIAVTMMFGIYIPTGIFSAVSAASVVPENAVHIATELELRTLILSGNASAGKYYVLDYDIELTDEWIPIVDFQGIFDGQWHTISNLYVYDSVNAGLFGSVKGATVKNVGVDIAEDGIEASAFAGGLIGRCEDGGKTVTIKNCWVKGVGEVTVSGDDSRAGGLIGGYINSSSRSLAIISCYAAVNVEIDGWDSIAGGLIGYCGGKTISLITNCYSTGKVSVYGEDSIAGGLIGCSGGQATSILTNCYAVAEEIAAIGDSSVAGGLIGCEDKTLSANPIEVNNCYRFDDSVIGMDPDDENISGEPLSKSDMKKKNSFVDWDFNTIWTIEEGTGYPSLQMNDTDDEIDDGSKGIDYNIDEIILYGTVNSVKNNNYSINLTTETITLPSDYEVAAYSVDGGIKWQVMLSGKKFDDNILSKLLNKGMTLFITDKYEVKERRPKEDAEIVMFPPLQERPKATKLVVNYLICEDKTGTTPGEWVLSSKGGLNALKSGIEIALSNNKKMPNEKGWGKFYDDNGNGTINGISIGLSPGGHLIKRVYLWRIAPTTDRAASKPVKLIVMSQRKAPIYKVNQKLKQIKVKAGTSVLMNGEQTPKVYDSPTMIDVSQYKGKIEIWLNATEKKPTSASLVLNIMN